MSAVAGAGLNLTRPIGTRVFAENPAPRSEKKGRNGILDNGTFINFSPIYSDFAGRDVFYFHCNYTFIHPKRY
jgi:hypothetical protein